MRAEELATSKPQVLLLFYLRVMRYELSEEQIRKAIDETHSMLAAAAICGVRFGTFKRYAQKFGLYEPNQGRKGGLRPKTEGKGKISLSEILEGKHPSYQTYKLKNRLLAEGVFQNLCDECGISDWNEKPLTMELEHVDGDPTNHKRENLRMLCPNCHAQTDTYCRGYKQLN